MKRVIISIMATFAVLSCSRDKLYESEAMVIQTTGTKSGQSEEWPCHIVIHRGSVIQNIGQDRYEPYFQTYLESIFDHTREEEKFNTKTAYPSNYDYVSMSGFAPAMRNDHGDREESPAGWLLDMCDNYRSIRVNYRGSYDNKVWAGIANAGPRIGSSISPFEDAGDALDFHYSAFRVKFRAIRSVNMSSLGVHNVTITIPHQYVPYSLEWDAVLKTYVPVGNEDVHFEFPLDYGDEFKMIPQEIESLPKDEQNYAVSEVVYLCKADHSVPLPYIHIDLHAEYTSDTGNYTGGFPRDYSDVRIEVYDSTHARIDDIQPGSSYIVTIIFDQDSFRIVAESEDWEEGGNINVQIQNPII